MKCPSEESKGRQVMYMDEYVPSPYQVPRLHTLLMECDDAQYQQLSLNLEQTEKEQEKGEHIK